MGDFGQNAFADPALPGNQHGGVLAGRRFAGNFNDGFDLRVLSDQIKFILLDLRLLD